MQDDEDERARRKANLEKLIDTIITATLIPRPAGAANYAIDDSGIWASPNVRARRSKALRSPKAMKRQSSLKPPAPTWKPPTPLTGSTTNPQVTPADASATRATPDTASRPPRTAKPALGITDTPSTHSCESPRISETDGVRTEPALVERVRLTPAGHDIVDVSLELIDSVRASGQPIKHLMADRHYSYKKIQRWLSTSSNGTSSQVVHLRADDHGFP
jgi:hypothetical protein